MRSWERREDSLKIWEKNGNSCNRHCKVVERDPIKDPNLNYGSDPLGGVCWEEMGGLKANG